MWKGSTENRGLVYWTQGFPGGSVGKQSAYNARDPDSIPGLGRCPGKEMATHSTIFAWRIPWTEEPGGLQSMGSQKSDTTEHLTHTQHTHNETQSLRSPKAEQNLSMETGGGSSVYISFTTIEWILVDNLLLDNIIDNNFSRIFCIS